jgi:hypothetical protein
MIQMKAIQRTKRYRPETDDFPADKQIFASQEEELALF